MVKILLLANKGLGDHIVSLPVAKELSENNQVHCVFSNPNGFNLLKQTPYFRTSSISQDTQIEFNSNGEVDLPKMKVKLSRLVETFSSYDKVYVNRPGYLRTLLQSLPARLQKNVIVPFSTYNKNIFRPLAMANEFGFQSQDISLKCEWYKDYYHDFKCCKNSVLLNCNSSYGNRTYINKNAIKRILEDNGFDVRELDYSIDIRTNIHLFYQISHVITTDTSTLWLTKAVGKQPYVFIAEQDISIERMEIILSVKNIVGRYKDINSIPPNEIVNGFLRAFRKIQL